MINCDKTFIDQYNNKPDDTSDFVCCSIVWLPKMLKDTGMVTSTSEAKRLLRDGAVTMDGVKLDKEYLLIPDKAGDYGTRQLLKLLEKAKKMTVEEYNELYERTLEDIKEMDAKGYPRYKIVL